MVIYKRRKLGKQDTKKVEELIQTQGTELRKAKKDNAEIKQLRDLL